MAMVHEHTAFARGARDDPRDVEAERLLRLQSALDPLTHRRLDLVGVGPGWRCLEVGAGRGSVARRLAQTVAPRGRVVATDTDLRSLEYLDGPYLEVREHDILTDPIERDAYDLVHCRLVLMHLSDPQRALGQMVSALRPGGWLVVEEPDFSAPLVVSREHACAGAVLRVYSAFQDYLSVFLNLAFAQDVLRMTAQLGLSESFAEQTSFSARGGDVRAITDALSWEMFRGSLLAAGDIALDDLDLADAAMNDPTFVGSCPSVVAVFGRKPA